MRRAPAPQPTEMTALEAVLAVDEEKAKLEAEVERLGDMMGTIEDMEVRGRRRPPPSAAAAHARMGACPHPWSRASGRLRRSRRRAR